jgi:hypothetical protein
MSLETTLIYFALLILGAFYEFKLQTQQAKQPPAPTPVSPEEAPLFRDTGGISALRPAAAKAD